jgi:hypothetical protein
MVEGYPSTAFVPRLAPNTHPITPKAGVMGTPGAGHEPFDFAQGRLWATRPAASPKLSAFVESHPSNTAKGGAPGTRSPASGVDVGHPPALGKDILCRMNIADRLKRADAFLSS